MLYRKEGTFWCNRPWTMRLDVNATEDAFRKKETGKRTWGIEGYRGNECVQT
jgi:hypothetical protein